MFMFGKTSSAAAETKNAKNTIALAKLLCQKGILPKSEIDQIFSTKSDSEPTSFTGNFPLDLLHQGVESNGNTPELIEDGKRRINALMQKFAIPGEIVDCISGPHFTNYEIALVPEGNTDVFRQIRGEICSTLNSRYVRILPSTDDHIFIEVPNRSFPQLHIRQLLESEEWKNSKAEIPLAIGKNTFGEPMILDLDKIGHLLIVGSMENGKSVLLNSLAVSLLHKLSSNELMLKIYTLQHTDCVNRKMSPLPSMQMFYLHQDRMMKELSDLVETIDYHSDKIAAAGFDDLTEYNRSFQDNPIPHCVIIIDNAGKLMSDKEASRLIAKIAKQGSYVGIHLILATRHTGTDVISGVVKKLFPTRLCFQTASVVDSLVVIDAPGAENLGEEGDMLMTATGCCHPMRINVASTTRNDIKNVIDFFAVAVARNNF